MYTKTSLNLFWLLLTVPATGCQSVSVNQTLYAATPDTSGLYFAPTMQEVLPTDQNAVYAASFPLAWQAIRKELRLSDDVNTASKDLRMLDGSETVKDALNEDDYERDITRRGQFLHVKTGQEVNLSFIPSFEDFPGGLHFGETTVNAFGSRGFQNAGHGSQVHISFYQDDNRFALRLIPPGQEHEVLLFKADSVYSTLQQMYTDLLEAGHHTSERWQQQLTDMDEVVIPKVDVDRNHQFQQFLNSVFSFKRKKYTIADATQQITFVMNEHGVSMKTEAEIVINDGSSPPEDTPVSKRLIFDKPFYIVMKKTDRKNPYMILYVADASLLEKNK